MPTFPRSTKNTQFLATPERGLSDAYANLMAGSQQNCSTLVLSVPRKMALSCLLLRNSKWDTFGTATSSVPLSCPPPGTTGATLSERARSEFVNASLFPVSPGTRKLKEGSEERKLLLAGFLAKIKSLKSEMNYQSNICRIRGALVFFSLSRAQFAHFSPPLF